MLEAPIGLYDIKGASCASVWALVEPRTSLNPKPRTPNRREEMRRNTHIETSINGEMVELLCEPRQSLLEVLRDNLHLTGSKEGCNDGNCGACTVIMDGRMVNSCLVLCVEVAGHEIATIESIAGPAGLHPIQQSYLQNAALQCGFCTPGFIVASKALLDVEPNPSEERIRRWLAGNLCRCTGYDKIVRAVLDAAQRMNTVA